MRFARSCLLGRLRKQTFFSLAEAKTAIADVLERINNHNMRRLGVSRRHLFETVEHVALASLPADNYEFAEWRFTRVSTDYHVEFQSFFYSVPHALTRQQVDIRATARMIEIFPRGKRVAVHQRRYGDPRYGKDPAHMPTSHRRYAEWKPERFRRWGASIGPQTEGLVVAILASRPHPEQGFRTCLGILRLYRDITRDRAEAVSARAVEIGGLTCKTITSLISTHKSARHSTEPAAVMEHVNLRGSGYFH
ncbi:Mu transposase domain-containing protein [Ensifer canadensis]